MASTSATVSACTGNAASTLVTMPDMLTVAQREDRCARARDAPLRSVIAHVARLTRKVFLNNAYSQRLCADRRPSSRREFERRRWIALGLRREHARAGRDA